jgi:hypothetical protein
MDALLSCLILCPDDVLTKGEGVSFYGHKEQFDCLYTKKPCDIDTKALVKDAPSANPKIKVSPAEY